MASRRLKSTYLQYQVTVPLMQKKWFYEVPRKKLPFAQRGIRYQVAVPDSQPGTARAHTTPTRSILHSLDFIPKKTFPSACGGASRLLNFLRGSGHLYDTGTLGTRYVDTAY